MQATNAANIVESRTNDKVRDWAKRAVAQAQKTNSHPLKVIFNAAFKNVGGAV